MHEIRVDQGENRLYITLTGSIRADESRTISAAAQQALAGLKARFACIVDLTRFKMKPGDAEWLLDLQDLLTTAGVSEIIHVGDRQHQELLEKGGRRSSYSGRLVHDLESAIRAVEQRE